MELIKKNIHMNKLKCKSSIQLTLDDDFNVLDIKPDIERIIREQGEIHITDVKVLNGKLTVSGILQFTILYISEEDQRPIHNMTGEIPFHEVVNMEEACGDDNINVQWELEDLSTSLINSRKISVRSIVTLSFAAEQIYDEETAIEISGDDDVKYRNKTIEITQIAVNKKDTFRIKDEISLSSGKANIFEILYTEINLRNHEVRLAEDKINLKGELLIFVLYTGESEENGIQFFETEVPFNGVVDCSGCTDDMIADVGIRINSKDVQTKPDADGEERVIELEVVLELDIKAYEEEQLELLSDLYSTSKELVPVVRDGYYENILMKNNSKVKVVDQIKVSQSDSKILQICNASGNVKIDDTSLIENAIEVNGIIDVHILYITEEDSSPLNSLKGVVPFSQTIEVKGIKDDSVYQIKPGLEQLSVTMLDSEEIEMKAAVNLNAIVFDKIVEPIITDVSVEDIDIAKLESMPSIIGYAAKAGDSLWKIAKKFYTTVENIQELNHLSQDKLLEGQKLLIVTEKKF